MAGNPFRIPFPGSRSNALTELLLRRGDIAAQGAQRSGDIWANAIGSLGQIAAGEVGRRQEQKAVARRAAAFDQLLQTWDGNPETAYQPLVQMFGPDKAGVVLQGLMGAHNLALDQVEKRSRATQEREVDAAKTVMAMHQMSPGERAMVWPKALPILAPVIQEMGGDPAQWAQPNEEKWPQAVAWAKLALRGEAPEKQPGLMKGAPGDVFFDPATREPVYSVPAPEKPDTRSLEVRLLQAQEAGDEATVQKLLSLKAREAAAGRMPEEAAKPKWELAEDAKGNPIQVDWQTGRMRSLPEGVLPKGTAKAAQGGGAGKLGATAQDRVASADQAVKLTHSLEGIFDPDWVGPLAGRLTEFQINAPGMSVSPKLARFYADTATLKNNVIKAITGAQMSVGEAERIMQQVPLFTDKPVVWREKLRATRENLTYLRNRIISLSQAGGGETEPAEGGPQQVGRFIVEVEK